MSRRQGRQRGAAVNGAVSAARRRSPLLSDSDRAHDHTQKREPPSTMHWQRAGRRRGRAAAERYAAAGAAARLSRRQKRQRGAAVSGAVSAARRRSPLKRKRLRPRPHAEARAAEHAQRASRRRGRAAVERHAAAGAAARLSQRQGRQRGAAVSGAVSATRRRSLLRGSDRAHDHTQKRELPSTTHTQRASCRRGRAAAERHADASAAA